MAQIISELLFELSEFGSNLAQCRFSFGLLLVHLWFSMSSAEDKQMWRSLRLMAALYIVQTYAINPGLASLPVAFYLKETLDFTADRVVQFQALVLIPWLAKPILGLLADGLPLWGFRYRYHFLFCYAVAAAIFWGMSAWSAPAARDLLAAAIAISTCIAFTDVLADRLMVTLGKADNSHARLQGAQWGAFGVGGAVMFFFSGWLAQRGDLPLVFRLCAGICVGGMLPILLWLRETPSLDRTMSVRQSAIALWRTITTRQFGTVAAFIVWLRVCPMPPLLFFERDALRFGEDQLGTLNALGLLGLGVGAVLFGWLGQGLTRRQVITVTIAASAVASLTLLPIANPTSAAIAHFAHGSMTGIALLGTLGLGARLCPEGAEATMFALVVSIVNLALTGGHWIGAAMWERGVAFAGVAWLGALCSCTVWAIAPFLVAETE